MKSLHHTFAINNLSATYHLFTFLLTSHSHFKSLFSHSYCTLFRHYSIAKYKNKSNTLSSSFYMINVCHSHQFYFLNTRFIELNKPRSNVSTESLYVLIAIHIKTATITIEIKELKMTSYI